MLPKAPSHKPPSVAVGVVLAAHGYPGEVRKGDVISGLDDVARDCPDVQLFYAGVKQQGNDLITSGGRVMTVVGQAPSFEIAIARVENVGYAQAILAAGGLDEFHDLGEA